MTDASVMGRSGVEVDPDESAVGRFWDNVDRRGDTDCWPWRRPLSKAGYGVLSVRGARVYSHRLSWRIAHGAWPAQGLVIDHLCRNRACQNPAHMEVVTRTENVMRGHAPTIQLARENRCIRGHEFTPENTLIVNDRGKSRRQCKKCNVIRVGACKRRRRERERLARAAGAA